MRRAHARLGRHTSRIVLALAGTALCAVGLGSLGGCGDGGSSGFDIAAEQRAEQQAIVDVAQNGECTEVNGIVVCGADMPVSGPLLPMLSDKVSLSPPSGAPLPCVGDAAAGCVVIIHVAGGRLSDSGEALQVGSTLLLAVGPVDPPDGWVRGAAVVYAEGGAAQAELPVTLDPGGRVPLVTGTLVRVAVLLYPPGAGVPALPPAVDLLSGFDADVAVVANDLVLQPSAAASQ